MLAPSRLLHHFHHQKQVSSGENRGEGLGLFESRSVKVRDAVEGFHLIANSHKLCRGFHQDMKARRTCLDSFIELFSVLRKRKRVCIYFNVFCETVNSRSCETDNQNALVIFVVCSVNKMTNQKRMYYPNYFKIIG